MAEREREEGSAVRTLRFAGAFTAWVIGSGFATGQEILQFVTSYGYQSFLVLLVLLIGFTVMGFTLTTVAFDHRAITTECVGAPDAGTTQGGQARGAAFRHYHYFCGRRLGAAYNWVVPCVQVIPFSILLSGAGATLEEYYGLPHTAGVLIMAALVLLTYFGGFERLTSVVALIGPVIILFTLVVGTVTILRDYGNFGDVAQWQGALAGKQNTNWWLTSAILYVSLNFVCGSVYYTELGMSARSRREVYLGTGLGVLALVAIVAITSTAILLNAGNVAALDIPTLYLAVRISPVLGAFFSVTLALGIYSSAATALFVIVKTVSGNVAVVAAHRNLTAVIATVIATTIGIFNFGNLISVFYPLMGLMGIVFTACVFWRCAQSLACAAGRHGLPEIPR